MKVDSVAITVWESLALMTSLCRRESEHNMAEKSGGTDKMGREIRSQDDSSDSENESEPAKSFHRRMSTNREIKTTVSPP